MILAQLLKFDYKKANINFTKPMQSDLAIRSMSSCENVCISFRGFCSELALSIQRMSLAYVFSHTGTSKAPKPDFETYFDHPIIVLDHEVPVHN